MTARKVVIGCTLTAALALLVVGIGGFLVFRHLTAPVSLPGPTTLVTSDSVGVGLLRLESDNAWIREGFARLAGPSSKSPDMEKITPVQILWTARSAGPGSEGHLITMSLSPSGRLLGLSLDFALWKAGRAGLPAARRVVHAGEGITSFGNIPGQFFVRGSTIAWGSDLEATRRGVDLLIAGEEGKSAGSAPPVMDLYPAEGRHALRAAVIDHEGSLARILAALPGAATPPPDLTGVQGMAFSLDPSPAAAAEGTGEIRLRYAGGLTPDQKMQSAAALAAWISAISPGGLRLQASVREESSSEALAISASGLDTVFSTVVRAVARAQRAMEKEQAPAEQDDQSSSTFQ